MAVFLPASAVAEDNASHNDGADKIGRQRKPVIRENENIALSHIKIFRGLKAVKAEVLLRPELELSNFLGHR